MTHECVQDFFIYVPPVDDEEAFSYLAHTGNHEMISGHVYEGAELIHESWVKIPLNGSIIVYARLDEELSDL